MPDEHPIDVESDEPEDRMSSNGAPTEPENEVSPDGYHQGTESVADESIDEMMSHL